MATRKVVGIKIAKDGTYTVDLKEGFSGVACTEKAKTIEMVLGGEAIESGKKDAYFDPSEDPVFINRI